MISGGEHLALANPWALVLGRPTGFRTFLEARRGEVERLEGVEAFVNTYGEQVTVYEAIDRNWDAMAARLAGMGPIRFAVFAGEVQRRLELRDIRFADGSVVTAHLERELAERHLATDPLVQLAKSSLIAQNGLLRWEHVVYQMAWKKEINPDSKPFSAVYVAMGADVATLLLASNATTVYAIDPAGMHTWSEQHSNLITHYFKNWESVDSGEEVKKGLAERRENGYWNDQAMKSGSRERYLIVELKKMGVDPKTVHIHGPGIRNNIVSIEFEWAYPGEQPKKREIIYLPTDRPEESWGKVDLFYRKSLRTFDFAGFRRELEQVPTLLNPRGVILLGDVLQDLEGLIPREGLALNEALGSRIDRLGIKEPFWEEMMSAVMNNKGARYAWVLSGARLR